MPKRKAEQETPALKEDPHDMSESRKQRPKYHKEPLYKASVVKPRSTVTSVVANDAILLKIRKCLDRGNHPGTPEHEAKAALHLASRWMATYNVSQAQLFAQEKSEDLSKHSGQCDVLIQRSDGDPLKTVKMQGHVSRLCLAVEVFFDCKSYSTGRSFCLSMSFYGIEANAIAAANAFDMIFNLVAEWSMKYKGNGPRESYCLGISDELHDIAKRAKRTEEVETENAETAMRIKEEAREADEAEVRLARLSPALAHDKHNLHDSPQSANYRCSGTSSIHSEAGSDGEWGLAVGEGIEDEEDYFEPTFKVEDGENNDLDIHADLNETINKLVKNEPQSPGKEEDWPPSLGSFDTHAPAQPDTPGWASHSQLVLFRDKAVAIADEYLKSKGVKLYAGRKKTHTVRDWNVYYQGQCDGHKIDMRGNIKRIEASKDAVIKEEELT